MDSDSSDSNSDVEVVPTKRPLITRRKLIPIKSVEDIEPSQSLYMSKVNENMKAIHSTESVLPASSSDVEEDADDIFSANLKNSRGRQVVKPVKGLQTEEKQKDVVELDESDNENYPEAANISASDQSDSVRERSPTPPPQLTTYVVRKRAPRRTKALKNAFSALEDLNLRNKVREAVDYVSPGDDVVILEETITTPSPVKSVPVKVRSRSGLHRFTMNKADSFTAILTQLAKAEGVSSDRCVLFRDDKTIEPYDSPESINLHIADILDLHIRKENEMTSNTLDLDDPDVIELSIQTKDPKSKLLLPIHKNMRLEKIMQEFAKERHLEFSKLSFHFDGDLIKDFQTPAMLEMESDDCIDVIFS